MVLIFDQCELCRERILQIVREIWDRTNDNGNSVVILAAPPLLKRLSRSLSDDLGALRSRVGVWVQLLGVSRAKMAAVLKAEGIDKIDDAFALWFNAIRGSMRYLVERGHEIFPYMRVWRLRTMVEFKHEPAGLERVLYDEFADLRMGDARFPVMVTAYDAQARVTSHLSSWGTPEVLMRDAARDTSAAPTFFPARDFRVDGGLCCNNPVMRGWVEARRMFGVDPCVISFGTGSADEPIEDSVLSGGAWSWTPHLIDAFMDANSEEAHAQAELAIKRYVRFNPRLPRGSSAIDDPRPKREASSEPPRERTSPTSTPTSRRTR